MLNFLAYSSSGVLFVMEHEAMVGICTDPFTSLALSFHRHKLRGAEIDALHF